MDNVRLLVVDDDPPMADLVATVARYEGWEAVTANSGKKALRRAAGFRPDIVVLGLMLPDVDGFGVLDRLRRSGTMVPVVFLTARDGVADRVAGLTRGGDDYLVKPFAVEELMARLRTVLRRSAGQGFSRSVLRVADLTMDEDTREVRRGERLLSLTPTEYEVLRCLMRRSPAVLTKAQILDHVWEYGFGGRSNVVEPVVSRLRRNRPRASGDDRPPRLLGGLPGPDPRVRGRLVDLKPVGPVPGSGPPCGVRTAVSRRGPSKLRPAEVANSSSEPPPTSPNAPRRETVGGAGRGAAGSTSGRSRPSRGVRRSRPSRRARRFLKAVGAFTAFRLLPACAFLSGPRAWLAAQAVLTLLLNHSVLTGW